MDNKDAKTSQILPNKPMLQNAHNELWSVELSSCPGLPDASLTSGGASQKLRGSD
jgi:hypothetical protein